MHSGHSKVGNRHISGKMHYVRFYETLIWLQHTFGAWPNKRRKVELQVYLSSNRRILTTKTQLSILANLVDLVHNITSHLIEKLFLGCLSTID